MLHRHRRLGRSYFLEPGLGQHALDLGRVDARGVAAHGELLEHVAQFARVAAPVLRGQQRQRVGHELGRCLAAALSHVLSQRLDQRGDVAAAFTQGRHAQRQHVEPVIEVFAKTPVAHQRGQVARRGRDHACIEGDQLVGAERLDLALLQRAQQLGLQAQGHVPDLVEKERAAVGQLELALAALAVGTREGTGREAEEFGLQQGVGHGRDVQADEGSVRPCRRRVDGMRKQFLAGARFAEQQHRARRLGRAPRMALDVHRRRAAADEARKGVLGAALPVGRMLQQRIGPLRCKLAPRIVEVALQHRELADERLQRRFGMVEQHDANGADHVTQLGAPLAFALLVQGNAADHEGAGPVGQQVDEDGLAGVEHLAHLRVGDDVLDRPAQEVVDRRHAERGQETLVALVDPDDAAAAIDQEHALADAGEQMEHRTRSQRENTFGVEWKSGWNGSGRRHAPDRSLPRTDRAGAVSPAGS